MKRIALKSLGPKLLSTISQRHTPTLPAQRISTVCPRARKGDLIRANLPASPMAQKLAFIYAAREAGNRHPMISQR